MLKNFKNLVKFLPIAAVIDTRIFCVYGGISKEMEYYQKLFEIDRPIDIPEFGAFYLLKM